MYVGDSNYKKKEKFRIIFVLNLVNKKHTTFSQKFWRYLFKQFELEFFLCNDCIVFLKTLKYSRAKHSQARE
jgi:hypothetical protein